MRSLSVLLLVSAAVGCGGDEKGVVKGRVTFGSKGVDGAVVSLIPLPSRKGDLKPGKPVSVEAQADGSFSLKAQLGPHKVSVTPLEDDDEGGRLPGRVQDDLKIDVKSGENTLDIKLVPHKR